MGLSDRDYMQPEFREGRRKANRPSLKDRVLFRLWRLARRLLRR